MGQFMNDDGSDVVREKIEKYMAMVKSGEKVGDFSHFAWRMFALQTL